MKLFVATGNDHKAREIGAILNSTVETLSLRQIGFDQEIEESGKTFHENAKIKLDALFEYLKSKDPWKTEPQITILADDSGMEVDFLNGAPGVYSARYAGMPCNDDANNQKLLAALKGVAGNQRTSRFKCVLACARLSFQDKVQEKVRYFEGICSGKIGFEPKGNQGFGYDPIFFPDGFCKTYAEITREEKNQISHRAKALEKFKKWFLSDLG